MKHSTRTDAAFLLGQGLLLAAYAWPLWHWPLHLAQHWRSLALALALCSLAWLLWSVAYLRRSKLRAQPSPHPQARLLQGGPYRWFRHPIYVGLLLFLLAWAMYSSSGYRLLLAGLLYLFFRAKSQHEERLLLAHFGPAYQAFMRSRWGL